MEYRKKDRFEIVGGNKLFGCVEIQTSKNAVLPIMSASLMIKGQTTILKSPNITDVANMIKILKGFGCKVNLEDNALQIDALKANNVNIKTSLMKSMRGSIFLLGSLLNRFKICTISEPGGCNIGARPINIHISAFKKLKVKVKRCGDFLTFDATKAKPSRIKLKIPSVGATENIIQFAVTLNGKTEILNAAKEPEVVDLCNFLNLTGAKIIGAGTERITIYGVNKLNPTTYQPQGDRIVAGTIMCAVAICGGKVKILNSRASENKKIIEKLIQLGCQIETKNDIITISREGPLISIPNLTTGYYPDFPTDLQSILLSVLSVSNKESLVSENVFENRFLTVSELNKMGANIKLINNKTAFVSGVASLKAAKVKALDLRGGAGLIVAALSAKGKTIVKNAHFVDRGYEFIEKCLTSLGANITRKWQKQK